MSRRFQVRIRYCEPTFCERLGREPRIFDWEALCVAASSDEASGQAIERFQALARASLVAWPRNVVAVFVGELV